MSFACPHCPNGVLEIRASLDLPPDGRSDDNTLQAVECRSCGFTGVAVYEESRRGAEDSWHHDGVPVEREVFATLVGDLARCSRARDPKCDCDVHIKYNQRDGSNWRGLAMFESAGERFVIRRR